MALNVLSLPPRELEFQMFVMDELADAAAERGEDVIKLTIGITDLPPPQRVLDAIASKVRDRDLSRRVYPEGLPALREAVARYYNEREICDIVWLVASEHINNMTNIGLGIGSDGFCELAQQAGHKTSAASRP